MALVTGAASGLGHASALRFAAEGAAVVCADLNLVGAEETADAIRRDGGRATAEALDVTHYDECERITAATDAAFGRLDCLMTCAGVGDSAPVPELDAAMFAFTMLVNVNGTFHCAKAAFPLLARQGGSIITIGSVAGLLAAPGFAAYGASKAAVIHLTRILAIEGARQNIRCNTICPSWIWTPMVEKAMHTLMPPGTTPEQAKTFLIHQAPLRRMGRPDEVASAAAYLASDEAAFMTGQELVLDGGITLGSRPM